MRINQAKRILMNEADSSPGNGAPVAPPAPAQPPAQNAAAAEPTIPVSQLKSVIGEVFGELRNGLFADLRKAGALGKEKTTEIQSPAPQASPTQSAPAVAHAGVTHADVESLLEQERVITRAATEHKLTDSQVKRMKSALKADRPDDITSWSSTYLADMGLAKAATQPPPVIPTPAPAPAAKPNISDRGTASPTDLRDSEGVANSRPLEMNAHDVDALVQKHGHTEGMRIFQERILHALGNVRIKPPRG